MRVCGKQLGFVVNILILAIRIAWFCLPCLQMALCNISTGCTHVVFLTASSIFIPSTRIALTNTYGTIRTYALMRVTWSQDEGTWGDGRLDGLILAIGTRRSSEWRKTCGAAMAHKCLYQSWGYALARAELTDLFLGRGKTGTLPSE